MKNQVQQRPSSRDTRQLLAHLIAAREQYSLYLHGVANGERQPDAAEKALLKMECDATLVAWRSAHEAWRLDTSPLALGRNKSRDN